MRIGGHGKARRGGDIVEWDVVAGDVQKILGSVACAKHGEGVQGRGGAFQALGREGSIDGDAGGEVLGGVCWKVGESDAGAAIGCDSRGAFVEGAEVASAGATGAGDDEGDCEAVLEKAAAGAAIVERA